MEKVNCLQCGQATNESYNRMIRDSCGHYKCRLCLLREDTQCLACNEKPEDLITTPSKQSLIHENTVLDVNINPTEIKNTLVSVTSNLVASKTEDYRENLDGDVFKTMKKSYTSVKSPNKERKHKNSSPHKTSPKILPSHILLESPAGGPKMYLCTICQRRFQSRTQISYHSYCNSTKPHACGICHKKFIKKSQLKYHLDVHSENKSFICDICNASFYLRDKLIRHLKGHSGVKAYSCTLCDSKFNNSRALNIHVLIHSGLKPHVCKTCGSTFRDSSNLRKHRIYSHTAIKYPCLECGKSYKRKSFLAEHVKSHTKTRPWSCPTCLRTFYTKKDLQRHDLIHTDVKPFSCQICHSSFKRKDNLERHTRNIHSDTNPADLQNISVIKSVSPLNLIKENVKQNKITKRRSSKININKNIPKPVNAPVLAPSKTFMENNYSADETYEDYYKNISEFGNYKNYIPKDFNNICISECRSPEGRDTRSSLSPLTNVRVQLSAINLSETSNTNMSAQFDNPTRLEIIQANYKRQSVIFNPPTEINQQLESNYYEPIYAEMPIENSLLSQSEFGDTASAHSSTKYDDAPRDLRSIKNKESEESPIDSGAVTKHNSTRTQKQTINVSDVYREMFPESALNFSNRQVPQPVGKETVNSTTSSEDKDRNRNPRQLSYIHKKVHYDLSQFSFRDKPNTSDIAKGNEQRLAAQNSPKNSALPEKRDSKSYFSPESLELYKKILIPSYKGSGEASSPSKCSELNIPPLAPISDRFSTESSTSTHTDKAEEPPIPLLVPLKSNIKPEESAENKVVEKPSTSNYSSTASHTADIHWRRRLAQSSNQDF